MNFDGIWYQKIIHVIDLDQFVEDQYNPILSFSQINIFLIDMIIFQTNGICFIMISFYPINLLVTNLARWELSPKSLIQ